MTSAWADRQIVSSPGSPKLALLTWSAPCVGWPPFARSLPSGPRRTPGKLRFGVLRSAHGGTPRIQSLAVLPLDNVSGDAEQDYFADGMTEELIANLAKVKALTVISRSSVMPYKDTNKAPAEIARELNTDGLIEGSVYRSGNRVKITAHLIEPATGRELRGQSYERELRDVLLQSEVAQAVVREIRVALTPERIARHHTSSMVVRARDGRSAAPAPIAIPPIEGVRPRRMTRLRRCAPSAPIATRMPSSRRCRRTMKGRSSRGPWRRWQRAGLRVSPPSAPPYRKKADAMTHVGLRELIPAATYSPTQLPTQYHRR